MRLALVALILFASSCGKKPRPSGTIDAVTEPTKAEQPLTLASAAKELGIEFAQLEEVERYRSAKKRKAVQVLFPRGDLRFTDLDIYRVDVTSDFAGGGKLEFRVGKKTVFSQAFEPDKFETTAEIPHDVRAALKEGANVTWGIYTPKGRAVTGKFKIVKESSKLQRRLDKLEKKFAGAADYILTALRAQLLLDSRLYYAAYRAARRASRMGGEDPQPYAIMQAALRRLKLHRTALYTDVKDYAVKGRFRGRGFAR